MLNFDLSWIIGNQQNPGESGAAVSLSSRGAADNPQDTMLLSHNSQQAQCIKHILDLCYFPFVLQGVYQDITYGESRSISSQLNMCRKKMTLAKIQHLFIMQNLGNQEKDDALIVC